MEYERGVEVHLVLPIVVHRNAEKPLCLHVPIVDIVRRSGGQRAASREANDPIGGAEDPQSRREVSRHHIRIVRDRVIAHGLRGHQQLRQLLAVPTGIGRPERPSDASSKTARQPYPGPARRFSASAAHAGASSRSRARKRRRWFEVERVVRPALRRALRLLTGPRFHCEFPQRKAIDRVPHQLAVVAIVEPRRREESDCLVLRINPPHAIFVASTSDFPFARSSWFL